MARFLLLAIVTAAMVPDLAAAADEPPREIANSLGLKLVRIPAGEFLMGSAATDPGAREDEQPQHRVRITRPFYLGVYEVTQAEFQAVMETNPSSFTRELLLKDADPELDCDKLPVDGVTWHQAVEFCRRLSIRPEEIQAGRIYRLPTEAEWEYACRAGTTTAFSFGDSLSATQANFNGEHPFGDGKPGPFLIRTQTVGSYKPNAFGLYDMHGNLHEWCLDWFDREYYRDSPMDDPRGPETGSRRVIRGGDWYSDGRDCRSAFRYADVPTGKFYALGMRVVCELTAEGAKLDSIIAAGGKVAIQDAPITAGVPLRGRPDPTSGEDWPRWRGPRGDGTWHAPKLPEKWPEDGLPRVWRREVGGGYGGVSVSDGRVYVMDRQREPDDVERVLCFDALTGEPLWSHFRHVDYSPVAYDNGPRSTPTVLQGRVYTLGAVGHLDCFDAAGGEVVWSKDLVSDFGARVPIWGLSASPLMFESLVIVHVGVEPNGCLMAFDQRTGAEHWRALADPAGYATPMVIDHDGRPQLVAWTPTHVRGLNPRSGERLWSTPFEVSHGNSIADPVFHEGMVLVSSYYDGSLAIKVPTADAKPRAVWRERRNLRGLMAQPLYRDGHAYLLDKRHGLTCFEFATGNKLWDDDNRLTPKGRNPQATLVWIGDEDRAIALNSEGELVLLRLNPDGYHEDSRTKILGETWAHPAYAGNCVFARSDTELICVLLPE
jgi:formylglycine-generating enzyme required for sulfatase activity